MLANAGEGLVGYRREAGAAGAEVAPALAAAPPAVSDGGRRLVFRLRDDARFGPPENRPVLPSDVKASLERLFLIGSPGRALYRGIRGARAFEAAREGGIAGIVARDGADEVEFRLTRPDPTFLRVLALPFAFVVPRGTPGRRPGRGRGRVGGPLPRGAYARGARIELERNRGYVAGAAGPAEGPESIRVELGVPSDEAVRRAGAGQVDYVLDPPDPGGGAARRAVAGPGAPPPGGRDLLLLHEHPPGALRRRARAARRQPGPRPPGARRRLRGPGGAHRRGCSRPVCRGTATPAPCRRPTSPPPGAWCARRARRAPR